MENTGQEVQEWYKAQEAKYQEIIASVDSGYRRCMAALDEATQRKNDLEKERDIVAPQKPAPPTSVIKYCMKRTPRKRRVGWHLKRAERDIYLPPDPTPESAYVLPREVYIRAIMESEISQKMKYAEVNLHHRTYIGATF
jgi:hypothetical protein